MSTHRYFGPDQYELDAHRIAGKYFEKWPSQWFSYSAQEHYPRRMWATLGGLLRIGKGRRRFRCKVADIAIASGQCHRTTQLALMELEIDGWIEREFWKLPGSKYNGWTKYTLPHLTTR
jgi:hypothetical protein